VATAPAAELERRAQTDPEGISKLLRAAIEKRRNFKPVGTREKPA